MTTLKGLVLKETDSGEASKSICVLTAEQGVIYIYVRGGKKSSKNASSTQAFSYSALCFEEKKNANGQVSRYLNSSEPVKLFYNIRLDAAKVALASYFSELLIYTGTEGQESNEVLRLALNSLYFLDEGKMDTDLLKCVFEFRLLCELGMRPKLVGCAFCFKYTSNMMRFNFLEDRLECENCCPNPKSVHSMLLDDQLLYIIRFIALVEYERLFYFRVSERYTKKLSIFTEKFVSYHLRSSFGSLEFYKMLK